VCGAARASPSTGDTFSVAPGLDYWRRERTRGHFDRPEIGFLPAGLRADGMRAAARAAVASAGGAGRRLRRGHATAHSRALAARHPRGLSEVAAPVDRRAGRGDLCMRDRFGKRGRPDSDRVRAQGRRLVPESPRDGPLPIRAQRVPGKGRTRVCR